MQQQEDQQNIQNHMCTNDSKLPKYTKPHVHKQQKDYQNIQIHMCITNNRKLPKCTKPYVHHKQQKLKSPKYTNPHVHKQQKITNPICASQTTNNYANPNLMNKRISKSYKSICAQTLLITCIQNISLVFSFIYMVT